MAPKQSVKRKAPAANTHKPRAAVRDDVSSSSSSSDSDDSADELTFDSSAPTVTSKSASGAATHDDTFQRPTKRVAKAEPESKRSERKDNDDNDDGDSDEEDASFIDVSFEFQDPAESDWWSIKALCTPQWIQPVVTKQLKKQAAAAQSSSSSSTTSEKSRDMQHDPRDFDLSTFADIICNQPQIGTVIHTDNMDNQPVGFITALNLRQYAERLPIQQIQQYLLAHAPTIDIKTKLATLLNDSSKQVALIVNERMINTPTELIPPLHESFLQDCQWARRESTAEMMQFKHDYYVLMCRCYTPTRLTSNGHSSSKKQKHKQQTSDNATKDILYHHFEEQLYVEHSTLTYRFDVEATDTDGAKEKQSRLVAVIPADKLKDVVESIQSMFDEAVKQNA